MGWGIDMGCQRRGRQISAESYRRHFTKLRSGDAEAMGQKARE